VYADDGNTNGAMKGHESIYWSGRLTTLENPFYGTTAGDVVEVLILQPQWDALIIVPTQTLQSASDYFKATLAPFASNQAKYAKAVIENWYSSLA